MNSRQRQWHRIDLDGAPQGHGLAREAGDYVYVAFEDVDGTWVLWRDSRDGARSEAVKVEEFVVVRQVVDAVVEVEGRRVNPSNPSTEALWEFVRENQGALIGTAVGILIGGLPGMLMNHMPVTVVGTQLGALVGGTAGTYIEATKEAKEAKKRLQKT